MLTGGENELGFGRGSVGTAMSSERWSGSVSWVDKWTASKEAAGRSTWEFCVSE